MAITPEIDLFERVAVEPGGAAPARPYKHRTPFATINKIRGILAELDCEVYEKHWANPHPGVYSVRLETPFSQGQFGQNGKGRTHAYCLASAYAEFVERVQNAMLGNFPRRWLERIRKDSGFYYYPDEKVLLQEEFDASPPDYLQDIMQGCQDNLSGRYFARLRQNGYPGCIAVPFYDTLHRKVVHLPFNLTIGLTGSNGMAAGNTVAEGLFQAICEILERFAAAVVYHRRMTPPTIPRDFLAGFPGEWAIIKEIERSGQYEVTVKDFSCGQHFPALGLVIRNRHKDLYRLNVGAETSFAVALSRCLTEIHQGLRHERDFESVLLPVPQTEHEYFLKDDPLSMAERRDELSKFTTNGGGVFPRSLFEARESYRFDPSPFTPQKSYEEEVAYLIRMIHATGHNVYLRDVSFLGFPSFLVYVPVMSPLGKKSLTGEKPYNIEAVTAQDEVEDLFFPFSQCTPDKMLRLSKILERSLRSIAKDVLKLEVTANSPWRTLPVPFLLTMFWCKLKRFSDAVRNLKLYMDTAHMSDDPYYRTAVRFLELSNEGLSLQAIDVQLAAEGFEQSYREDVGRGLGNEDHIFDHIPLPNCPQCSGCRVGPTCLTAGRVELMKRVNQMMAKTRIEQGHFGALAA